MLATVKGYYDGDKIVIDEYVKLVAGQQVMVTILENDVPKLNEVNGNDETKNLLEITKNEFEGKMARAMKEIESEKGISADEFFEGLEKEIIESYA